jgi:hypothetical protein
MSAKLIGPPMLWLTLACMEDVNENSQTPDEKAAAANLVKFTLGNIPLDEFDQEQ